MSEFIERVKVVASAAVTWITVASSIVVIVSDELADVLPGDAAETVGAVAVKVVAVLAAAVAIIRRVTPVLPEERGVLPPPSGLVDRDGNPVPLDRGEASVAWLLIVVAVVVTVLWIVGIAAPWTN